MILQICSANYVHVKFSLFILLQNLRSRQILFAYMEYKYLERHPHFYVFSPNQFEFPLHSTERPGKSSNTLTVLAFEKFITRYITCGTFWRTEKRTNFCTINIFTIVKICTCFHVDSYYFGYFLCSPPFSFFLFLSLCLSFSSIFYF